MSEVVIRAEHMSKMYRLGVVNNGTLFRDIQSFWARLQGREDPHSKLEFADCNRGEHFWALKDLSFDIHEGDRVAFIGKNGAGKSTLLKILSRITVPTEGVVKMRGKVSSLLEVGTGFHYELTGRENIYLNGAVLGMKKKEIDAKLDAIIDFSGVGQHIDTPMKRYSSGMQVRLGFAVASHLNCDILIADEVLAVGDIEFQKKALSKMDSLSSSEGKTILFVSHNLNAVKNLCNKGFILDKGRLISSNDNINENISKYMEMNEDEKSELSLEMIKIYDNSISLDSILINGSTSRQITYFAGSSCSIEFSGKTNRKQKICLEFRIKNELDAMLAYYNRGHFVLPDDFEVGNFYVKEEFKIPNIITGRYIVDLYISSPETKILLAGLQNAFVIDAIGIETKTNVSLFYNDVGFIKID